MGSSDYLIRLRTNICVVDRKVGFVNRENGTMTLCHLENNELKFDAYFMSNYLKFQKGCELIKQIYGTVLFIIFFGLITS